MGSRLFLLCVASLLSVSKAYLGVVTSFTKTPSGAVLPGILVTFTCQALGVDVGWYADESRISQSSNGYNVTHDVSIDSTPYTWNLTLSTVATIQNNHTEISCHAMGTVANQAHQNSSYIQVAGTPLSPRPNLENQSNGTILQVTWDTPFSPLGFNVTSYNLTIHNASSGIATMIMMESNLTYDIINPTTNSTYCHDLNITLRAVNMVGQSNEGFVKGGFLIIPQIGGLGMEVEVVFMVNGSPRITIQFQVPMVCSFQSPAHYILVIVDKYGREVSTSGMKTANSSTGMITESFVSGINQNNTYRAELTISHRQVAWEVTLTKDTIVVPKNTPAENSYASSDTSLKVLIISLSSLGFGLILVVCVMVVICGFIIVRGIKKRKRPTYPERRDLALPRETFSINDFKLEPPPKGKNPKSLVPMAFNPIYDGPTYESPGGESFKSLLGSCSVPTTPMTDSPRYFNPPPTLPPPRKASISKMPNLPEGIPEEHVQFNCYGIEEYTEMKPVRSRVGTIGTVCTAPLPPSEVASAAVYEAMDGEYKFSKTN